MGMPEMLRSGFPELGWHRFVLCFTTSLSDSLRPKTVLVARVSVKLALALALVLEDIHVGRGMGNTLDIAGNNIRHDSDALWLELLKRLIFAKALVPQVHGPKRSLVVRTNVVALSLYFLNY
jgi:hypothetical protein